MKAKLYTLALTLVVVSMSACHYGADAVKEDVARNEEYKGKRAEQEAATALPADAAAKMNGTAPATEATEAAPADSTAAE